MSQTELLEKESVKEGTNLYSYDEMPYESYPYSQTHPRHLRTIGMMFGMKPTALEKARVLELGCAAGGNIIPFALDFPKSEVVGVDLSSVQVNQGKELIESLGIKNIQLHAMSITDIDESFGKFDYIICHGVYSWVPEFVREKILEISKKNLTPNGISYISYNTLPGWNMVRTIRDMMVYHSSTFTNVNDKVSQARLLLNFVSESIKNTDSPYSKFLENEINILRNQSDHYLRHEHLEDNNHQFYFHEFASDAKKQGLQYLSDTGVSQMFLGNFSKEVSEKLSEIKDIVRTEQYLDFISNRRFRCSLLCNDNLSLNRQLNTDDIAKFHLNFNLYPEKNLSDINIEDYLESICFYTDPSKKGANISTTSTALKAVFYTLYENNKTYVKYSDIIDEAAKKAPSIKKEQIDNEFKSHAMRLVLSGNIKICFDSFVNNIKESAKPKVSELVRAQAQSPKFNWVTNNHHERISTGIVEKFALRYLDGKTDKNQLVDKLYEHVKSSEIVVSIGEEKITDEALIKKELLALVDRLFVILRENSLQR